MSHPVNTEILENLYEEILDDLTAKNIQLTNSQYDYLYDLIMSAYDLDVPDQKGWDIQTFDNLVDNVCNAKQTYLTNDVKGV